jgi:hypothetical protein
MLSIAGSAVVPTAAPDGYPQIIISFPHVENCCG